MCAIGDDHDDDAWKPAVSLDEQGRLHGSATTKRASDVRPAVPPAEEPLELVERPPVAEAPVLLPLPTRREEPPPPEPPGSSPARKLLAVAVVLGGCLFAAAYFLRAPARPFLEGIAPEGVPVLTIDSVPSDAAVLVDGAKVGRTPYVGTNEFPAGATVRLRIARPGYKAWEATFRGGVDVRVTAVLRR